MQNFLNDITKQIDDIISNNPKAKDRFKERLEAYRQIREKYLLLPYHQALQRYKKDAIEKQLFYDEKSKTPPKGAEGLELETEYPIEIQSEEKTTYKYFYRPPLPFNPDDWIKHYYGSSQHNALFDVPKNPKKPNESENIICKYAVLSVIHDYPWENAQYPKLTEQDDKEWACLIWNSVNGCYQFNLEDGESLVGRTGKIVDALEHVRADLAKNRKLTATDFNKIEREVADYFIPQSWTILEEAKTIVEYAIENPATNTESILHRSLDEGTSKTRAEINASLTANKTLSDETKDSILKDFQTYLDKVLDWMIKAYQSKTLLEPLYLNLRQRQQTLFDRISNLTDKTKAETQPANGGKVGETKQQSWKDNASDYINASEAIVTFTKSNMPQPTLSKMLRQKDNTVRWMRKGQRCKVHIGDFKAWAEKEYPPDSIRGKIADEVLECREKQQLKENYRKFNKLLPTDDQDNQ